MKSRALLPDALEAPCAVDALRLSPIPALRRLLLEETGDRVVLSGRLSSYYYKQLAQETIVPFLDGRELVNRVEVRPVA